MDRKRLSCWCHPMCVSLPLAIAMQIRIHSDLTHALWLQVCFMRSSLWWSELHSMDT